MINLSAIVACGKNGVIGHNGKIPWHLPSDLARFRSITMGKPILMGRLTFDSIGRILPGRFMVVISRNPHYFTLDNIVVEKTIEKGVQAAKSIAENKKVDEILVIGGSQIYKQLWSRIQKLYLTTVHLSPQGDTFFKIPDPKRFRLIFEENLVPDKNSPEAIFQILERVA